MSLENMIDLTLMPFVAFAIVLGIYIALRHWGKK